MRTPEQGHTKRCLAAAMICAVENARDDGITDLEFRLWAQENRALTWADLYLDEGTATCTCPPIGPDANTLLFNIRARQLQAANAIVDEREGDLVKAVDALVRDAEALQTLVNSW
jgi:hypothetical protein